MVNITRALSTVQIIGEPAGPGLPTPVGWTQQRSLRAGQCASPPWLSVLQSELLHGAATGSIGVFRIEGPFMS